MRRTSALLTTAALAFLGGCATVPPPLVGDNFSPITPQQAAAAPNPGGERVRWGGEILKVEPRPFATCFEILSRELYSDARPTRHDHSEGRFIACKAGFFDPAVYTEGRDITIVGAVNGSEKHKVGQFDYTFAKVDAETVYMWPVRTQYAGYYDPFWGCDPFWGPCYGYGWGGYWGWGSRTVIVSRPPPARPKGY
jgi:outer membrane lipoprotein